MHNIIANAYGDDIARRASTSALRERFHWELGLTIGTSADPKLWADNFGCDIKCAEAIIADLKAERRCVERDGRLYSI